MIRQRGFLAGFQTHVAKPVDPAELTAAVATLAFRTGKTRSQRTSVAVIRTQRSLNTRGARLLYAKPTHRHVSCLIKLDECGRVPDGPAPGGRLK